MTPQRIRLRRTKGWRLPEGAINVARPTKWGNPYRVALRTVLIAGHSVTYDDYDGAVAAFRSWARDEIAAQHAHGDKRWPEPQLHRRLPLLAEIRSVLAGHDLACWCPLDQPCHADVLLEIANS